MKIYVDEMPIQVRQRVIYYDDGKTNCVELEFVENVKPTEICDTQSLKQQVREEVVEEIIKSIDDKFNCLGYVEEKFEDVKKYILDQVKGETK